MLFIDWKSIQGLAGSPGSQDLKNGFFATIHTQLLNKTLQLSLKEVLLLFMEKKMNEFATGENDTILFDKD